ERGAGAIFWGGFASTRMIGFVYGFPAIEAGHVSLHSHMLAVRPDSRNLRAGIFLKLAQRTKALELGLDEISWTFDPLQVLNANLNFARLGVLSERYIVNFYGEETSSPLHRGVGTDRLWVRWLISTERVKRRIASINEKPSDNQENEDRLPARLAGPPVPLGEPGPLVLAREGSAWRRLEPEDHTDSDQCLVEIPADIGAIKRTNIDLAHRWRSAVQSAFVSLFTSGFVADEFVKAGPPSDVRWYYVLTRTGLDSAI